VAQSISPHSPKKIKRKEEEEKNVPARSLPALSSILDYLVMMTIFVILSLSRAKTIYHKSLQSFFFFFF